jgi:hypothetical protein
MGTAPGRASGMRPRASVFCLDEGEGSRETCLIEAGRLTMILPALTLAAAIKTTRIHRVAGRTGARTALVPT